MEELFERFLADRWRDRPATLKARRFWFRSFSAFCQEQSIVFERLSIQDLQRYQERLLWVPGARGSLSAHFIRQGLGMLRTFLRWAVQRGLLSPDPTENWVLGRPQSREKKLLTRAQLEFVLHESTDQQPLGLRDHAILGIQAELGLTPRICHSLDLADLDLARYRLSRKPISHHLAESLGHYLKRGRPALLTDPDETALFLTHHGTRLSTECLARVATHRSGQTISAITLRRSWLAHQQANVGHRLTDS